MNSLFAESALVRIVVRLAIPTHVATHLFPDLYPAVSIISDSLELLPQTQTPRSHKNFGAFYWLRG